MTSKAYQLSTFALSANVAALTANNTSFVGSVSAANVVSNAQLQSNLASYQTTAGLSANVAKLTANNTLYLGGIAANLYAYANQISSYTLPTANTTTLGGVKVDGSTITISNGVISASGGGGGGGGTTVPTGDYIISGANAVSGYIQRGVYTKSTYSTLATALGNVPDFNKGRASNTYVPTFSYTNIPQIQGNLTSWSGRQITNGVNSVGGATSGTRVVYLSSAVLPPSGLNLVTTNDGVNWYPCTADVVAPAAMNGVAYGNGIWVAAGGAGFIYTSTDGVSWKLLTGGGIQQSQVLSTGSVEFLGFVNDRFFLSFSLGTAYYTSVDGLNWVRVPLSISVNSTTPGAMNNPPHRINQVLYDSGEGIYFASILNGSTTVIVASSDGIEWTQVQNACPITIVRMSLAGGNLIVYGNASSIYRSPYTGVGGAAAWAGGNTWTLISGSLASYTDIEFWNGSYWISHQNGGIYSSSTIGGTYSLYTTATTPGEPAFGTRVGNSILVPLDASSAAVYSPNGLIWYTNNGGTSWTKTATAPWSGNQFVHCLGGPRPLTLNVSGTIKTVFPYRNVLSRGPHVCIDTAGNIELGGMGNLTSQGFPFNGFISSTQSVRGIACNGDNVVALRFPPSFLNDTNYYCLTTANVAQSATNANAWGVGWMNGVSQLNGGKLVYNATAGQFVVSGANSTYAVATSPDGFTWTGATVTGATAGCNPIDVVNGYTFIQDTSSLKLGWSNDHVNWSFTATGMGSVAHAVAYNGTRYVAALQGGIQSSVASGGVPTTWSAVSTTSGSIGTGIYFVKYISQLGIFVSGGQQIWTSTDGATWTRQLPTTSTIQIWDAAYDDVNGVLFVISSTHVYTTTNGTTWKWKSITANSTTPRNYSLNSYNGRTFITRNQGGGMSYVTEDGGATWKTYDIPDYMIQIVKTATGFAGMSGQSILYSPDGINWVAPAAVAHTGALTPSNIIKVPGTGTLILSVDGNAYRSTDGGDTFTWVRTPVYMQGNSFFYAGSTANNTTTILGVSGGASVVRSVDDGVTWQHVPSTVENSDTPLSGYGTITNHIDFFINKPGTNTWTTYSRQTGAVFTSTDNGTTWKVTWRFATQAAQGSLWPIAASQSGFYLIGHGLTGQGVFFSADGITWELLSLAAGMVFNTGPYSYNVAVKPDDSVVVAVSTNGFHYSLDGGITWEAGSVSWGNNASPWDWNGYGNFTSPQPVIWDDTLSIFYLDNGIMVLWSSDGINWKAVKYTDHGFNPAHNAQRRYVISGDNLIVLSTANMSGKYNKSLIKKIPLYSYDTSTQFYVPANGLAPQTKTWIKT